MFWLNASFSPPRLDAALLRPICWDVSPPTCLLSVAIWVLSTSAWPSSPLEGGGLCGGGVSEGGGSAGGTSTGGGCSPGGWSTTGGGSSIGGSADGGAGGSVTPTSVAGACVATPSTCDWSRFTASTAAPASLFGLSGTPVDPGTSAGEGGWARGSSGT